MTGTEELKVNHKIFSIFTREGQVCGCYRRRGMTIVECVDVCMAFSKNPTCACVDGRTRGRADGWTDGRTDGRTDSNDIVLSRHDREKIFVEKYFRESKKSSKCPC